jgi:hypothetical protein
MAKLIYYLKNYWTTHFNFSFYLTTFLFLSAGVFINYFFHLRSYLYLIQYEWIRWPINSAIQGFPFLMICGFMYIFGLNKVWVKSKEFWLLFFVGFGLVGFTQSRLLNNFYSEFRVFSYYYSDTVLWMINRVFFTIVPLLFFYYFYERSKDNSKSWYGLKFKDTDFKPYFILIGIVFIGVGIGSFLSDLSNYYPLFNRIKIEEFAKVYDLPKEFLVLFFQLNYACNFVDVEFFYRGFLVMGFARVLGGHAVMAMVGSYVFLHFGKPMSETISSAFGGYIIGVFAFYSNRIWGGVILHIALAWSMEFFGWLQNLFNN